MAQERWAARPAWAWLIRAFSFLAPIVASIAFVNIAARVVPMPTGSFLLFVTWWILLSAAATGVLLLIDLLARRLLPLAALFKLSLVFPDRAPSRFEIAMRTGTVATLEQRVAEAKEQGQTVTPVEAAQRLLGLVAMLDQHDKLTRGHSERVRAYSQTIAREMRLGEADRDLLNWAALLHDVGKLDVPKEILTNPGKPSAEEWAVLRRHPEMGEELVAPLREWLGEWIRAVGEHHERWDGRGYPRGRSGEAIGLASRIVAVADVFDVITSVRSYKPALSTAQARSELAGHAGTQFDERVVRAFLNVGLGRLRMIMGPLSLLSHAPLLARMPLTPAVTSLATTLAVVGTAIATGLVPGPGTPALHMAAARAESPPRTSRPNTSTPEGLDRGPVAPDVDWVVAEDTETTVRLSGLSDPDAAALRIVAAPHAGTAVPTRNAAIAYTPPPNYHGRTSLEYEACWQTDRCALGHVGITVRSVNDLPQPADDLARTQEDEPISIDVLANDSDPDHEELGLAAVSDEGEGSATLREGRVAWRPPLNFTGKAVLGYAAEDAEGGTASGEVTVFVAPVNDPPLARADEAATDEDVPVRVYVLANDVDPDGDKLEVVSVGRPSVGQVTHDKETATYFPPHNFAGTVSFEYTVTDGAGGRSTKTATISLAPVNDPPRAVDDAVTLHAGASVSLDVLGNDDDPEGGPLSVASVRAPSAGTAVLEGDQVRFTAPSASGSSLFEYVVRDRDGATARASVSVTILGVNLPPTFTAGPDQSVLEDAGPRSIAGWASAISPGNRDNASEHVSFLVTTTNTALFTAGGQPAIAADGTLTFIPVANASGSATVMVRARDDGGTANGGVDTSPPQTFAITVAAVNDPPSALPDSRSVAEDTPAGVTFNVLANDTDVEGDVLSLASYDDSTIVDGTLTDDGGGQFTFVPEAAHNGLVTFSYTVGDGNGGTDTTTVSLTVTAEPDAPLAGDDAYATSVDVPVVVGAPGLLANDGDEDGDPVTAQTTLVAAPANGSVTLAANGSFTYTPNAGFLGTDAFTYRIGDGTGRTDDGTVTITVAPVGTSLLYLGTSGPLPDVWDLTTTPAAAVSPVPDHEGDGLPGLTIVHGNGEDTETDGAKWQAWARPISLIPLVLNGPVSLRLWSTTAGFDADHDVDPHVYLYDCLVDGLGCVTIAQNHVHVHHWNAGVPDWGYRELTIGSVSRTIPAGHELRVRLQVSHHDIWVASTDAYRSALAITGP